MPKKGVLLLNIGTPNDATLFSVWKYLRQFLSDPRIIDLPKLLRWFLVNFIILPFRIKKSTKAYQEIWMKEGSPLLVYSKALKVALATELGEDYQVEIGMCYGNPSIKSSYQYLKNCEKITVIPLFPQYSAAATASAIANFCSALSQEWDIAQEMIIKKDFYHNIDFIEAYANVIKKSLEGRNIDFFLFSYHGLPERHLRKSGCQTICNSIDACPEIREGNKNCYRAQCFATSRLLAKALSLTPERYQVSFQSRLGKTPWIKPYTDLLLPALFQRGIRSIAIACPSFVTDCLETLEEIHIQARKQWLTLGGSEFILIPCLNTHPAFIKTLVNLVKAPND